MQFSDNVFSKVKGEKEYLSITMKISDESVTIKRQRSADEPQQVSKNIVVIHGISFDVIDLIHELERIAYTDGCLPCMGCRLDVAGNCQEKGCGFIRRAIEFIEAMSCQAKQDDL